MKIALYLGGGLLGLCLIITPAFADSIQSIGWIEEVHIPSKDITFIAKIDTGADNSSLNARDVKIYELDGKKRVRFDIENKEGESSRFDLPLARIANIKRKRAEPIKRPVVNMTLCIGNILKTTQVNLAKRKNFKYQMLIGRSFLKDNYLVNSAKQFTRIPSCKDGLIFEPDKT